jgi:hypothetical protein
MAGQRRNADSSQGCDGSQGSQAFSEAHVTILLRYAMIGI